MRTMQRLHRGVLSGVVCGIVLMTGLLWPGHALQAAPLGAPDTCEPGFVWREAFPGDHVCVTPAQRDLAKADNAAAASRRVPGSDTCQSGFVWREARPDDHVCVTPQTRDQVRYDNSQAAVRRAGRPGPNLGESNVCAFDRPCILELQATPTEIVVEWSGQDTYDAYNLRWSVNGGAEHQVELGGGGSGHYTIRRPDRHFAGNVYRVQVQGCDKRFLASAKCSPWAAGSLTTTD